jgi:3',5'-cyclic AMP phosphodiesterase CpdA
MHVTRREFTIAFGAAGASFCLPGVARPAPGPKRLEFAIISDSHIQDRRQEMRALTTAIDEINASAAAFTVCLGDLVNKGAENPDRYPEWKAAVDRLAKPWHAVPGNHDPVELFRQHVQDKTDFTVDADGVRLVLFQNSRVDSHKGFLTPEQLSWIDAAVAEAEADGRRSILLCHVPAHRNVSPDRGYYLDDANGGSAFAELLERRRRAILAVFSGHNHCGLRGWDDRGVPEVIVTALGGVGNNRDLTKAPGWHLGPQGSQPNGYTQVAVHEAAVVVRYKPVGADVVGERELAAG